MKNEERKRGKEKEGEGKEREGEGGRRYYFRHSISGGGGVFINSLRDSRVGGSPIETRGAVSPYPHSGFLFSSFLHQVVLPLSSSSSYSFLFLSRISNRRAGHELLVNWHLTCSGNANTAQALTLSSPSCKASWNKLIEYKWGI